MMNSGTLKAPSHLYSHLSLKQPSSTFKVRNLGSNYPSQVPSIANHCSLKGLVLRGTLNMPNPILRNLMNVMEWNPYEC